MTASHTLRLLAPFIIGAAFSFLPSEAGASTITFTNTGDPSAAPAVPPLSVELTSDILLSAQGNFTASCRKEAASDVYCAGIQTDTGGPTGEGPVLQFTVSRTAVDLADADKSVTLQWSTTPASEICIAAGNANATNQGWGGLRALQGPATFTYSAIGTYEYLLACYNAFGKSQVITHTVEVESTVPLPQDDCTIVKSQIADPVQRALFQPEGFEPRLLGWNQLFGPGSVYPNPLAAEVYPVGSYTLAGNQHANPVSTRGRYLSVPITGNGSTYKFEWIQAKPSTQYAYAPNRPTDFKYVTLSTCQGDFRTTSSFVAADPVNDPTLIQQCRNQVVAETGIGYGPTGFGRCPVRAGQVYYLNIVFADPAGGLLPSETGCRDTFGGVCETSWRHSTDND